jgi:hypothetical protein
VPDSRRGVEMMTGRLFFWNIYDDNGTYMPTLRVLDMEGAYTDFTRTISVTNVAPSAQLLPSGNFTTIGDGVPIIFRNLVEPSHADHLAGFTYYFRLDGSGWASSGSPEYLLPEYVAGPHVVEGYIVDKDGGQSPIFSLSIYVQPVPRYVVNHGNGSVLLTWDGGSATLGPDEHLGVPGAGPVAATLMSSGASYTIQTNASFSTIDNAAGVAGVYLMVQTNWCDLTGTVNAVSGLPGYGIQLFLGHGDIGQISVPPGSGPLAKTTLRVFSRGDLAGVEGADSLGLNWSEAQEIDFDDLSESITHLDRIAGIHARGWLGNELGDEVWARVGIEVLGAYGVAARIVADTFFDESDIDADFVLGHLSLNPEIQANTIGGFIGKGDADAIKTNLLLGSIALTGTVIIDQAYTGNNLLEASILGDGNAVFGRFVKGRSTGYRPILADYFPVAFFFVVPDYAGDFWEYCRVTYGITQPKDYEVHHSLPQGGKDTVVINGTRQNVRILRHRFAKAGENIDKVENLRGCHKLVHDEVELQWTRWRHEQMRKMYGNNINVNDTALSKRFWWDVPLEDVRAQAAKLEPHYADAWIKPGMETKAAKQAVSTLKGSRQLARWEMGQGARTKGIFPKFAVALAVFTIFQQGKLLADIVDHTPEQLNAWNTFSARYKGNLNTAFNTGRPPVPVEIYNMRRDLVDYLTALKVDDNVISAVNVAFTTFLSGM